MQESYEFQIPYDLNSRNALQISRIMRKLPVARDYYIDFSEMGNITPFAMLVCGAAIREFHKTRKESQGNESNFYAINYQEKSYAAHMGFFKSFSLNHGKDPGEAPGSNTYIPISEFDISRIRKKASRSSQHLVDTIENETKKIAKILTQYDSGPLVETLTYSLREVFRNVAEHSQCETLWYCGQYWPVKNKVEIAILDEGIGVRESLSRNPNLSIQDDFNALNLALKPGISGSAYEVKVGRETVKTFNPQDEYANSGFGLFMTSSICKEGGSFTIASKSKALYTGYGGTIFYDCYLNGTALRLAIDTTQIANMKKYLKVIRRKGEEIAKETHAGNLSASLITSRLSNL